MIIPWFIKMGVSFQKAKGQPHVYGHVDKTADAQKARCDDTQHEKLDGIDLQFTEVEGDNSLK